MGRPEFEDSVAGESPNGDDTEATSTDFLYFGADSLGSLSHGDGAPRTLLGTLQESDNGRGSDDGTS